MSEKILTVEFVTPEKRVWSGKASMVSARTLEGDLGILPDHAPLLGVLVDGTVTIKGVDGSSEEFTNQLISIVLKFSGTRQLPDE